jgi:NAD(P)H-hydrate epimerase
LRLLTKSPSSKKTGIGFIHAEENEGDANKLKLPPLVLDADGLKLLAEIEDWYKLIPESAVLTPHPGEMAVMTGLSVKEIQANRLKTARKYAKNGGI